MKHRKTLLALLLAVSMMIGIVPAFAASDASEIPLVVAYSPFSEKFSTFFADTAYDRDVSGMTQVALMTTDRMGGIIYNAIEGETVNYNGTDYHYTGAADLKVDFDEEANITTYTAKIRDDLKFSDGVPVTADDIIFTYYVLLDPAYVGSTTLNSYKILGLNEYMTQTSTAVYDKYSQLAEDLFAAGRDHEWAEGDAWTKELQEAYWAGLDNVWKSDVNDIVNYVYNKYISYAESYLGYTADEIKDNEGLKVALGMALWGFGKVAPKEALEEGAKLIDAPEKILTGAATKKTWDLTAGEYPTVDDYFAEVTTAYENDPVAYVAAQESPDGSDIVADAKLEFVKVWGPKDEAMGGEGVPNIKGIKKLDDYTVEVKTEGYEAPAVYSILGIDIAPKHYYGDPAMFNYEENQFGHPFGDLTIVGGEKNSKPVGAGPYKFVKYENRVVYFEANENYYKGAPKIKYVQFKETAANEVAAALRSGAADAGEMSGTKDNFATLQGYNSNGEITGDVITTSKFDNLGYGYLGINADTVNVGGKENAGSEASKNLRKGFATVLAIYREVAFDSYYGEAASVINYPISNTSWAAPQPTDPDYKVAFSVDVDGNDIYTSDMTPEQKYEAAKQAAVGFFKAAGFTFDEATGKFTAAPEGAKMSYEIIVPGDGKGDHPNFAVMSNAKETLAEIGIELKINDPANSNELWNALDSGEQEMWTAAWGSTIDPDMYQVYHSSNIVGLGGSDSNHYHIADEELDKAIIDARQSDDQAYRKTVYKKALDIIVDWAVEVPAYQRQNCIIFSTERINLDTLTPDITTYWGWMAEIEKLEMNAK
ncbi:MAG: ABC transporter substrate-binding protein [Eubacteriales bacterium]|nr:ABC transporter substrate-binding protein [Eubacteriales bacterium]